jgi:hypothetical protein
MSSAKRDISHPLSGVGKFTSMMLKSRGLRTLPWGTPLNISLSSERSSSTRVLILLPVRKFLSHNRVRPLTSAFVNLNRSQVIQALSYASDMSKKIAVVEWLFLSSFDC